MKLFIPLWDKHATIPLTIIPHDHILTKSLRALSPFPTYPIPLLPYSYFVPFMLFLLLLFCFTLHSLNSPPCTIPPHTC